MSGTNPNESSGETRLHRHFGENNLVEPNGHLIRTVWKRIGGSLCEQVQPGVYQDRETINKVLHTAYSLVEKRLDHLVRRLASRELMEFLLYQYDLATELWQSVPGSGNLEDMHRESHLASRRRALKHLAEQTTMCSPPEYAPVHLSNLIAETEEAILNADILVTLYMMSDRTHFLFPRHSQLTLFKNYELVPIQLDPVHPFQDADLELNRRFAKDREHRHECFPGLTADRDPKFQCSIVDGCFSEVFGLPYSKFLFWLNQIIEAAIPAPGSYPIVFYPRDKLVAEIASSGIHPSTVKRILSGFTLRSSDMKGEGRQLRKAKQTYRAYRRGFFEFPNRIGPHLTWSASMARESLNWLITGACFKKLPAEWTTPETTAGLDKLSKAASNWFESHTIGCLSKIGIKGSIREYQLQGHGESIDIPPEVGEIDFLGYSTREDLIVVVECKMVESRMEARFWNDDIAEFVDGKKSYAEKFRRKFHWVLQNRAALSRVLLGHEKALRIAVAMLTLYPSFTAIRIKDFPCVSLSEFMADFDAAQAWPYQIGVFNGA